MKKQNILCFVSHPDDLEIGAGGTVAKYAAEGHNIIAIIFSNGALSHPWLKEKYITEKRVEETKKIEKSLGVKETIFLGLPDLQLENNLNEDRLKSIIKKYNPDKVFTHSIDTHKDHIIVHKIILKLYDELNLKLPLYTFDIWKMMDKTTIKPRLYIDITPYFKKKVEAIKSFKTQKLFTYLLLPSIYYKAYLNGRHINVKYAEVFNKER